VLASLQGISSLLAAIFTGGLLLVAIVAAWYTRKQLRTQSANAKLARVYALSDRTSDTKFMAAMMTTVRLLNMDSAAGRARWDSRRFVNSRPDVLAVLNFFEEVAGEYCDGLLDESVADRNVAYLAVNLWTMADRWFADLVRGTSRQDGSWDQLEKLSKKWDQAKPIPRWKRASDL
jgi:hypothetical protein